MKPSRSSLLLRRRLAAQRAIEIDGTLPEGTMDSFQRPFRVLRVPRSLNMKRRHSIPLAVFLAIIAVRYVLVPVKHSLFGDRTMGGGSLGRLTDTAIRTIIYRRTVQRRTARLKDLGLKLPPMKEPFNTRGIPVLPQVTLYEVLVRDALRNKQLQKGQVNAETWKTLCNSNGTSIPKLILQPDYGASFRPLSAIGDDFATIHFGFSDMRRLVRDQCPLLLPGFDQVIDKDVQIFIWSICALYEYGGYVFGRNVRDVSSLLEYLDKAREAVCDDTGAALFQSSLRSDKPDLDLAMAAVTPRHPLLRCLILNAKALSDGDNPVSPKTLFLDNLDVWERSISRQNLQKVSLSFSRAWDTIVMNCSGEAKCCSVSIKGEQEHVNLVKSRPELFVRVDQSMVRISSVEDHARDVVQRDRIQVTVKEAVGMPRSTLAVKRPIHERLDGLKCEAGWICNRCLKNALYGTYASCRAVCQSCYKNTICNVSEATSKDEITIDVVIKEREARNANETRIPKIIHQTWYDEPIVDRYPQLARLQNSWRNTGWEYRFYTDATAREFISSSYPSRFLDAFDSLVPGAFKADLFRYLLLLKEGGIYADTDMMLDTNLDSFVTPELSFFGPHDNVGEYAEDRFCLWNGLMGSTPGHPFLVRAVERVMAYVLNRADYYDIERGLCLESGPNTSVWKARAVRILMLTGPCLLGLAVNDALGRESTSSFEPGWLYPEGTAISGRTSNFSAVGDAMILSAAKHDMGATRFSDVERNLMVASTGMDTLSKDPVQGIEERNLARKVSSSQKSHIHYSAVETKSDIFGAAGVYRDNMVTNEIIKLRVTRLKV